MRNYRALKGYTQGYLLLLVLIFGSVFFVIMSSMIGYMVGQSRLVTVRYEMQQATDIAEAGLNYYRWYLAHNPDDTTNGTGLPGPYVQQYFDPEGAAIGQYSLSIASTSFCGSVASIRVTSTGNTYSNPQIKRTVTARYVRPTVAEYAYIINSSVWAGPSRTIIGPYHSNGGIRMDGTNLSTVSSGQATWSCTPTFGCTPTTTRAGVFTTTGSANPSLFYYPSAPINFTTITLDLNQMKTRAQNAGGIYIPKSAAGSFGYRVTFNSGGTITVRRVTGTTEYWGNPLGGDADWALERNVISSEVLVGTYTISASCPLIFVEDKVWIEGVVNQKVTIAAADVAVGVDPSVIINGNITYATSTAGLLAVAEQDVLLGVVMPNGTTTLNGIFVAQKGRYGRNFYCQSCTNLAGSGRGLPGALDPYVTRPGLSLNGTVVSNGRVGEQWVNTTTGVVTSGYLNRLNTYDRNLVENPPPLVPNTSDVYVFRDWQEVN